MICSTAGYILLKKTFFSFLTVSPKVECRHGADKSPLSCGYGQHPRGELNSKIVGTQVPDDPVELNLSWIICLPLDYQVRENRLQS